MQAPFFTLEMGYSLFAIGYGVWAMGKQLVVADLEL
jgi:hypothetical protein